MWDDHAEIRKSLQYAGQDHVADGGGSLKDELHHRLRVLLSKPGTAVAWRGSRMYKNDCPASIQCLIERIKKRVTEIHTSMIRFDYNTVGTEYIEGIDSLLD